MSPLVHQEPTRILLIIFVNLVIPNAALASDQTQHNVSLVIQLISLKEIPVTMTVPMVNGKIQIKICAKYVLSLVKLVLHPEHLMTVTLVLTAILYKPLSVKNVP